MLLGTTYSITESKHLNLNHKVSFYSLLDLDFDIIRLGAYWSLIEPQRGEYQFEELDEMMELCQQRHQKVLLVIGMKAPRWPEFFIPEWLSTHKPQEVLAEVSLFLTALVNRYKHFECLHSWQVENEPFDQSGPNDWIIPSGCVAKEVALVRQLDPSRDIHLTLWGNALSQRENFPLALMLADSIGLDLYYRHPSTRWWYTGPDDSDEVLADIIRQSPKPVWITELQAEPWEHGNRPKWLGYQSMNPGQLQHNYHRAAKLNPEAILFWGYEYWYAQKQQGNNGMWNTIQEILHQRSHL